MIAIIGTIYEEMIHGKELGLGGPVFNVIRMSKWLLNNIMMNISSVHVISCIGDKISSSSSSSKLFELLLSDQFSYIDQQINKLSPRIEYLMKNNNKINEEDNKDRDREEMKEANYQNSYKKLYNRNNKTHCCMNLDANFITTGIVSKHRYIYIPLELLFESSGPKVSLEISKMVSWSHPKSAKALIVSLPEINTEQELIDLLPAINSVLIYADFVIGSSKSYHQFAFHCFGDDSMPLEGILKRMAQIPKASTYRPRTMLCIDSYVINNNNSNSNIEISNSNFESSDITSNINSIERRSTNGLNTALRGISNSNNIHYTNTDYMNDVKVYMQIGALELVTIPYDRMQLHKLWMEHESVITSYNCNNINNNNSTDSNPDLFINTFNTSSSSSSSSIAMAKLVGEQVHSFTAGFITALSLSEYQMEERKRAIDPVTHMNDIDSLTGSIAGSVNGSVRGSINGSVNGSINGSINGSGRGSSSHSLTGSMGGSVSGKESVSSRDSISKSSRSRRSQSSRHSTTTANINTNSNVNRNPMVEEGRDAHILATARGLMQCVQAGQFSTLTAVREWTRELNIILSNINSDSDVVFNRESGDAYDSRPCSYFQ